MLLSTLAQPKLDCARAALCTACPQIHLSSLEQEKKKRDEVRKFLVAGLGELGEQLPLTFHSTRAQAGYRDRIRLRIDARGKVIFFNPGKDAHCPVLSPGLRSTLQEFLRLVAPIERHLTIFSHLELRAPDLDGRPGLFLTRRANSFVTSAAEENLSLELIASVLGDNFLVGLAGRKPLFQRCALTSELYYYVPLGSFRQVNERVNQALLASLVQGALTRGVREVADLYCGSGNFLLPLLAAGLQGVGVEIQPDALIAGRRSAGEQGLTGEWRCEAVFDWSRRQVSEGKQTELLVLDPPRAGLKEALQELVRLDPSWIALCSCHVPSLVKDLACLQQKGFKVQSLELFDMFEHTNSVEILVWLAP